MSDVKMETDSRKRPLDGDFDGGASKRSNQGGGLFIVPGENIHLKVLVPSIAAGAIIGKGGETITQIQKETGAVIKMSKANDFYPGTTERVCLITGCKEHVVKVHDFIMEKIREKPDPNPKPVDGDLKVNFERHKQVKILIPNTTAGMVIGKAGVFIRQIKDDSGAYVQISQKSKDLNLPERCVTIAAGDVEQNKLAVELIISKIVEDPQSGSCPNISYQDYKGPVASSNPTGSPFANSPQANGNQGMNGNQPFNSGTVGTIGTGMNNLNLNSGGNAGISNPALENLKATLRGSGYAEQAVEEISAAMYTLANYGFLGLGLGLGLNLGNSGGMGNLNSGMNMGNQQGGNTLNLANLAGILSGNAPNNGGSLLGGGAGGNGGAGAADSNPSVFGPVGSTTTTLAGGDTGEGSAPYFSSSGSDRYAAAGDSVFSSSYNNSSFSSGYSGTNQNSFGLGTNMGTFGSPSEEGDGSSKKDVEVGEHIVGAILGPGGKGIVELQKFSGANIQISKKGVYAPGTRNRIVTIAGSSSAVQRAQYLIQQRIVQEEAKRARQGPVPAR